MKTVTLAQEVMGLLKKAKGDWARVAVYSGVSHSWISKFVNGHIKNPGISTLAKVKKALGKK